MAGHPMKVKLVRDHFHEGRDGATVRPAATSEELRLALQAKIHEEAEEIARDPDSLEEYADLMEVVLTLARLSGFAPSQVSAAMVEKHKRCGGFSRGLIMSRRLPSPERAEGGQP